VLYVGMTSAPRNALQMTFTGLCAGGSL